MSEYQYYEFRAVDRSLNRTEQGELRAISTRARITATSFMNHYEWGDLKGDPDRFMERYFDLFVYLSNWGSRRFSMRLPKRLLDAADLRRFLCGAGDATVRSKGDHLIVDVQREELDLDDEWDDGHGWLGGLAPLRADVLDGDLRVFYLVWQMAVETGDVPDDAVEPLAGIAPLTTSLEAFADFLHIDRDLVAAAAGTATQQSDADPPRSAVVQAIAGLDQSDKMALLLRLYDGDPHVRAELRRHCRASVGSFSEGQRKPRTVADLRAAAGRLAEDRCRAEAARLQAEQRKREEEAARAQKRRLAALEERGEAAWREVESLIGLRSGAAYEKAASLLVDLRELALRQDTDDEFHRRVAALRAQHKVKPRFIGRLAAVGLD
jgi:hypothetical protein